MAKEPTLAHPPVEVLAHAFIDAISKVPSRGGVGRQSGVPKDTLLSPHAGGIMVETPVLSSLVGASHPWRIKVSVDAKVLVRQCDNFRKIGALKDKQAALFVSVSDGQLRLRWNTTTIGVPLMG